VLFLYEKEKLHKFCITELALQEHRKEYNQGFCQSISYPCLLLVWIHTTCCLNYLKTDLNNLGVGDAGHFSIACFGLMTETFGYDISMLLDQLGRVCWCCSFFLEREG